MKYLFTPILAISLVACSFASSPNEVEDKFDAASYKEIVDVTGLDLKTQMVKTEAGELSVLRTNLQNDLTTVVFIHCNSGCKEMFLKQFKGLHGKANLIAVDLIGHGKSHNAHDPESQYSFKQYGKHVYQVLKALNVDEAVIAGWSLGGHVAMEMIPQFPEMLKGIFMTGSPAVPSGQEGFLKGFKPFEGAELMGEEKQFEPDQAEFFVRIGGVNPVPSQFKDAAVRTHGLARKFMFVNASNGTGVSDEQELLEETDIPFGIVIGKHDEGINGEFIKESSKKYKALKTMVELDTGHATLWQDSLGFNEALMSFIKEIDNK